uniref:Methyltransferase-like protein 2-A n=2 Tax=Hirondellea gigas TaxID=1518452 RepID=A0A2P2HXP2_9CRUS
MSFELDEIASKEKSSRPQFGGRFLVNEDDVFKHNAWDNVEWGEKQEQEALAAVAENSPVTVSEEKLQQLEEQAATNWDLFYGVHQNKFFKNRNWLFTEFPELAPQLTDTFVVRVHADPTSQPPGAHEEGEEPTCKNDVSSSEVTSQCEKTSASNFQDCSTTDQCNTCSLATHTINENCSSSPLLSTASLTVPESNGTCSSSTTDSQNKCTSSTTSAEEETAAVIVVRESKGNCSLGTTDTQQQCSLLSATAIVEGTVGAAEVSESNGTCSSDTADTQNQCSSSSATSGDCSFPGAGASFRILEIGCGVGNTIFPILKTNNDPGLFVYGGDFSCTAIDIIKQHQDYNTSRCNVFVLDATSEDWSVPFPADSLDVITCIYTLSAIRPDRYKHFAQKVAHYLKPGGVLLFRDYGRYDLAQLRYKKGKCLAENFYMRGDGTRCYFFTQDEIRAMFTSVGMKEKQNIVDRRLQVNRGKQLTMYRVWVQAKYIKPKLS